MNVKVKFVGKVNHMVEGIIYEPGKIYQIDSKVAQHPFFEIQETPKPAKPKPEAKKEGSPKDAE